MQKNYTLKIFYLLVGFVFLFGNLTSNAQVTSITGDEYGRLQNLIYDQNVQNRLYATTLENHILVSNDNGASWDVFYSMPFGIIKQMQMLNDTHLSFYMQSTGVEDDDTVYMLNLSTLALTQISRPQNMIAEITFAAGYSIYEGDTDIILYKQTYRYMFETFDNVYYTTDGGASWTLVYEEASNNNVSVNDVLINYDDPNTLFLARGPGSLTIDGGLLVSTDAGSNWTEYYDTIRLKGIAVDPNNPDHWIVGTFPPYGVTVTVYQTYDAGANWTELAIPFDDYSIQVINKVVFDPVVANKIYILEANEIAISTDGGSNWDLYWFDSALPESEYHYGLSATINPFDSSEVIYSADWYPFRSIDGGVTSSRIFSTYGATNAVGLSPDGGGDPYLYYGAKGGFIARNMNTSVETTYNIQQIDYVSNDGGSYIVDENQYGRIFSAVGGFSGNALSVSNDHGQTFHTFYNYFDPLVAVQPDPVSTNEVWVAFDSWGSPSVQIVDVTSSDPWAPIVTYLTMPATGRVNAIWINPSNNDEVLASQGGQVWSTTDRGANWTNASSGLTLDPDFDGIYDIQENPNNAGEFFIATTNGIWKSSDLTGSWTQILATDDAKKIVFDPNHPEALVVPVYTSELASAEIHYSEDNGSSWTTVSNSDLALALSFQMAFDFTGTGFKAYLSTTDLGIVTYDVSYSTLSVETPVQDSLGMRVYPNPVQDVLNVEFNNGMEPNSITIYDLLGNQIKNYLQKSTIDLSSLSSGIYLVKVSDGIGLNLVRKIVKK